MGLKILITLLISINKNNIDTLTFFILLSMSIDVLIKHQILKCVSCFRRIYSLEYWFATEFGFIKRSCFRTEIENLYNTELIVINTRNPY